MSDRTPHPDDTTTQEPTMPATTININDQPTQAPEHAIAYKFADPIEDARWIYDADDLAAIKREDPSLIGEITVGHTVMTATITRSAAQAIADAINEMRGNSMPWDNDPELTADDIAQLAQSTTPCDRCDAMGEEGGLTCLVCNGAGGTPVWLPAT